MLSEAIEKDRQQQCEQQQQNRTKSGWNMHCKCCCRNRKKRNHRSQKTGKSMGDSTHLSASYFTLVFLFINNNQIPREKKKMSEEKLQKGWHM